MKKKLLVDIDADSSAFDAIMDAMRLPKSTEDKKLQDKMPYNKQRLERLKYR